MALLTTLCLALFVAASSAAGGEAPLDWQRTVTAQRLARPVALAAPHDLRLPPEKSTFLLATGDVDGDGVPEIVAQDAGNNSIDLYRQSPARSMRFVPAGSYQVEEYPTWLAVEDLNGDTLADIVSTNSKTFSVLLNAGNGAFLPAQSYQSDDGPRPIVVEDFDSDGDPDLAIGTWTSETLQLFLNDGMGAFSDFSRRSVPYLAGIAGGDFTGDGYPDLAVGTSMTPTLQIFANNGSAGFVPGFTLPLDDGAVEWLGSGDLDHDGDLDLVVLHSQRLLTVLLNDGAGVFSVGQQPVYDTDGGFPGPPVLADLTGDGRLDLAFSVDSHSGYVSAGTRFLFVASGQGDGAFLPGVRHATGVGPLGVAAGDLAGDGFPELVLANEGGDTIRIYPNDSNGGLGVSLYDNARHPTDLALSDVNADGALDAVTTSIRQPDSSWNLTVLLNDGAGGYGGAITQALELQDLTSLDLYSVVAGDIDRQGASELVVAGDGQTAGGASAFLAVLEPAGDGRLMLRQELLTACGYEVALIDSNRDGWNDVLLRCSDSVALALNDGNGDLLPAVVAAASPDLLTFADGDLDGDAWPDLLTGGPDGTVAVFRNRGDGSGLFSPAVSYRIGAETEAVDSIAVGDVDENGALDLVAFVGRKLLLLSNDGEGGWTPPLAVLDWDASVPPDLHLDDINRDGSLDILLLNAEDNALLILPGDGDGTFLSLQSFSIGHPALLGYEYYSWLAVGDIDGDAVPDVLSADYGGTLSVLRNRLRLQRVPFVAR